MAGDFFHAVFTPPSKISQGLPPQQNFGFPLEKNCGKFSKCFRYFIHSAPPTEISAALAKTCGLHPPVKSCIMETHDRKGSPWLIGTALPFQSESIKKEVTRLTQTKKIGTRWIVLLATLLLCVSSMLLSASAAGGYQFPEHAAPVNLTLDGQAVLSGEAAIIDSVTYVPLRSFAELAGADAITWNASTQTATVKKGTMTLTVTDGASYIVASGRYFYTSQRVLNINDRLFVPVRPLAKAFCMDLTWNASTRTVVLKSTRKTLISGDQFYNANDLYWLSRIISAEAGGESLYGQIAVGNVVLNRVAHKQFPNTIYGVIFDRVGGTQFTPVALGTIYRTPTASSVIAAKICLEGTSISNEILFFMNPRISTSNWISKNRPFAFTIGNHDFYK
jgi:N-acetylmuramoyl-L-alanine amidase